MNLENQREFVILQNCLKEAAQTKNVNKQKFDKRGGYFMFVSYREGG